MGEFRRPVQGRWIAGVCAGLAAAVGIDVVAVRIIAVIASGVAVPVYVVLWIFTPSGDGNHGVAPLIIRGCGMLLHLEPPVFSARAGGDGESNRRGGEGTDLRGDDPRHQHGGVAPLVRNFWGARCKRAEEGKCVRARGAPRGVVHDQL